MVTLISNSPEETAAIGREWGHTATAGWLIGLRSELGAGKTQLAKGIAAGLKVLGRVQSPTFALVNEYHTGRLPLYHLDLYRLENRQQIIRAGLEDYLNQESGVTVVEWCDRWTEWENLLTLRPFPSRNVHIEQTGETQRRICYEDFGP